MDDTTAWFAGRLPEAWFEGAPEVSVDRDEVLVVGRLPAPGDDVGTAGEEGRIGRFREETREERMRIADEAGARFGRTISWGARCGETRALFTHVAAPVMTRLRQPERQVLDTLVEAGVARSRSDAVGWCVRLVGEHEDAWLAELHDALAAVREARGRGPASSRVS